MVHNFIVMKGSTVAAPPVTPPSITVPLPQSTLIKIDSSTMLPFTTNQKYCIASCTVMVEEMQKYLVGPMPPQEFLDIFFPLDKLSDLSGLHTFSPGCYNDAITVQSEKLAYDPFVSSCIELLHVTFTTINPFSRLKQHRIHVSAHNHQFVQFCRS